MRTSPRSCRSATLIPSPSILEIAIPRHCIHSPLFFFPQSLLMLFLSCGGLFAWFGICRASGLLRHREFGIEF
ncbi:hypothetical protein MUK42_02490 [Musa troglodytarum]|uniref:Uncharacterized protein n=1 Tax=Musa troglodytarum TaxID=320322 RepID=A0A9E7JFU4_9LILI|nr:hypothetical protein MUK42_02490 [Musa troglodytarum]